MLPVAVDTCLRCNKPRTLPSFSVTPVTPTCSCTQSAFVPDLGQLEAAVQEALSLYRVEHETDAAQRIVMRLGHVASCAGEAWNNKEHKFYVSCLVSSAALSRLLLERAAASVREVESDESSPVAGARSRHP